MKNPASFWRGECNYSHRIKTCEFISYPSDAQEFCRAFSVFYYFSWKILSLRIVYLKSLVLSVLILEYIAAKVTKDFIIFYPLL